MFKGKVIQMLSEMLENGDIKVEVIPTETGIEKTEVNIYIEGKKYRVTK